MLRFANNSYDAACFLVSDEEHHKRKTRYVVVLPAINRQIMDLWFSLVYITDDFACRSLLYEKGAYRELRKQIDRTEYSDGKTPEWFEEMRALANLMETLIQFTPEEKQDPEKHIPSWPHPHGLSERQTKSQAFLQLLHGRIYADTSVEAHLKPAGLMVSAGMLLLDVISETNKERVKNRDMHVYKARQLHRTVMSLLGVISEIELYCNLGNKEQAASVWKRVAENSADAKAVFEERYKAILN